MPFASDQEFTITQVSSSLWRLNVELACFDNPHLPDPFIIPVDFICDGSSIPRPIWSLIGHPLWGAFGVCGFLHDRLYRIRYDRKKADLAYVYELEKLDTPAWQRALCYWALRTFGGFAYVGKAKAG